MLGRNAGVAEMGFIFDPAIKQEAQDWLQTALLGNQAIDGHTAAVRDGSRRLRLHHQRSRNLVAGQQGSRDTDARRILRDDGSRLAPPTGT